MSGHRALLERVYAAAIAAVGGRQAVARALSAETAPPPGPVYLVAVGKAAAAMAHGVADSPAYPVRNGLVITREGYQDPALGRRLPVRQLESAHPIPDERSLEAGEALVQFLTTAPANARFLFLISGGASSLVERLEGDGDQLGLARLNQSLLASGLDIARVNAVRQHYSTIKAGRLARWLAGRPADVLLISDVPGDNPAVIGSGLLVPSVPNLSGSGVDLRFKGLQPAPTPPATGDPLFQHITITVVASNATARAAAAQAGRAAGWDVHVEDTLLTGEAAAAGPAIARQLVAGPQGMFVQGGEPTVTLPPNPGQGGRMQTLALSAAAELADSPCALLAAGTDGADGPGDVAGAIVDGETLSRGEAAGGNLQDALANADAGRFLSLSGDLLVTGGTGTNVMDLVIGLRF